MVKASRPASSYVPDRGDIVWLNFSPQAVHEQAGRRPALVLSPKLYNEKVKLALFCPITSRVKGYTFEVILPESGKITGAILCDQIKNLDLVGTEVKVHNKDCAGPFGSGYRQGA